MGLVMRGGRIADPVHGYVDYTWLERQIFKHALAQRLRYVSQNGLAHLVYPEARSSRFSHSLGAMHLASHFLAAAFENSREKTRKHIGEALVQSVQEVTRYPARAETLGERLAEEPQAAAGLIARHYCASSHEYPILLAEQGFRLAAFFHDLGHLPFSHDFEGPLKEYWWSLPPPVRKVSPLASLLSEHWEPGEQPHERIGHGLARLLMEDIFESLKKHPLEEPARVVFAFAFQVLNPPKGDSDREAAVRWLHKLMAGDLDIDRSDYLLRDGRNYGFRFAEYDLHRLLDNLAVTFHEKDFRLVVRPKGLSALESYLVARFRSYRYGVFHHKVAQVGTALRRSILKILQAWDRKPEIEEFLQHLGTVGTEAAKNLNDRSLDKDERTRLVSQFSEYDDVWWMSLMREALRNLEDEDAFKDPWLGVACRRDPATSLWKRIGHLPLELRGRIGKWNQALPQTRSDKEMKVWDEFAGKCEEDLGVLLVRHDFSPWDEDPVDPHQSALLTIREDAEEEEKIESVSAVSPVIAALPDAWMRDVQVHAFVPGERSDEDVAALRQEVLDRITQCGKRILALRPKEADHAQAGATGAQRGVWHREYL